MKVDLMEFSLTFDDIALDFFNHFFYEQDGIIILLEVVTNHLFELLFLHHHTDKVHSNNKL